MNEQEQYYDGESTLFLLVNLVTTNFLIWISLVKIV